MKQRFQTFLDHSADQCDRHRSFSEFVVVEWNPEPGKQTLKDAMSWPSAKYLSISIVTVSHAIYCQFENAHIFPLFHIIAKNVGIRRARSPWVLCTNVDILFSDALTEPLAAGNLDAETYYRIDRHDLGVPLMPDRLSPQTRLAFCEDQVIRVQCRTGTVTLAEYATDEEKPHSNACGDFTLLFREKWFALQGYPEFSICSIYIDGLLLYAAKAIGMWQKIFLPPYKIYHIEHGQGWVLDQKDVLETPHLDYRTSYILLCNKMLVTRKPLRFNTPN